MICSIEDTTDFPRVWCAKTDGSRVVCGTSTRKIREFDLGGALQWRVDDAHAGQVKALCMMKGGRIVSGGDRNVHVWERDKQVRTFSDHQDLVTSVIALSPGKDMIVSGSRDKTVKVVTSLLNISHSPALGYRSRRLQR